MAPVQPEIWGRAEWPLGAHLTDDGATFARGRTVLVAADRQGKPVELPAEVRTDLSERLIA